MSLDFLKNKTILITGGTGSFGRSFINFILKNNEVRKVIVFSRDEFKQFHMQKEIQDKRLSFFLGDVRDLARLQRAFKIVDVVIHAAALKQVPALEYNPFEAVKTNILGSQN
ncbi:MAG: polysaccharide biosynthesis protein, partial [Patescibacteria group bacterium]